WISGESLSYKVDVRAAQKQSMAGKYEVRIEELRAATPQDESHIAAQKSVLEAKQLVAQGTKDSKLKAIDKYIEALPLYRAVGDRNGESNTLNNIGVVHDQLGEKQRALEYYNQALPLYRAVGDRSGEAITLNNIGIIYNNLGEQQKALEYYNQALPLKRA